MATTSSGQGSIRERANTVILKTGKPLTLDEIFEKMKADGYPLPAQNPKEVIKIVLTNKVLFKFENNRYFPIKET